MPVADDVDGPVGWPVGLEDGGDIGEVGRGVGNGHESSLCFCAAYQAGRSMAQLPAAGQGEEDGKNHRWTLMHTNGREGVLQKVAKVAKVWRGRDGDGNFPQITQMGADI